MKMNIEYPYNDEFMEFNKLTNRYQLTERALLAHGIDVREMMGPNPSVDPTYVINQIARRTSQLIYNYIHQFNTNTQRQDMIIAKTPSLRPKMYEILGAQALYMIDNGDLSLSTNPEEKKQAIDEVVKGMLAEEISEYGVSILYGGTI